MKRWSPPRRPPAPLPPILISSSARLSVTAISRPLGRVDGRAAWGLGGGVGGGGRPPPHGRVSACPRCGPQHRLDDVLVAGAAAQVARESEPRLVLGGVGVGVQ